MQILQLNSKDCAVIQYKIRRGYGPLLRQVLLLLIFGVAGLF